VSVLNRIDIPVGIVAQIGSVPLKIGVVEEHLLVRTVGSVVIARAALKALAVVDVSVIKAATRAVPARLSKSICASRAAYGRPRSDCRNRADAGIRLVDNGTMGASVLIIVEDRAHRSVVTDVIAALHERVHLVGRAILGNVISCVGVTCRGTIAVGDSG